MKCRAVLSLSIAAACLVFLGPHFAQARSVASSTSSMSMSTPHAGHQEALKMVPAKANLLSQINAQDVRAGEQFRAKLSKKVDLKNGPELPRGTVLIGRVVKNNMNKTNEKSSTLALCFTQAMLSNGTTIPIKATIVGIYPPTNAFPVAYANQENPNYWTPKTLQVDQINALKDVDLHSKIASSDSGILVAKNRKNVKLRKGSEFALAIARQGSNQKNHATNSLTGIKSRSGA